MSQSPLMQTSKAFLIFVLAISILIIVLSIVWNYCFSDWWEKRNKPKTFKIVVDLSKLTVNSPEGISVDCFKDSRKNKIHLIIQED